jgi:hypothetical protein
MKSGKAQPTRVVPDNKAQDRDLVPARSAASIPSNRTPPASPPDYGCGPRTPPAPLDPISNASNGADDRSR